MYKPALRHLASAALSLTIIGWHQPLVAGATAATERQQAHAVVSTAPPTLAQRALSQRAANAQQPARKPFTARERVFGPLLQKLQQTRKMSPQAIGSASPNEPAVTIPGFAQATPFLAAASPSDLSATNGAITLDVNKDGLADLVNVQSDGTLNVLLNPGKGKLGNMSVTSTNRSAVTGSAQILYLYSQDLNGDGYPDLVALDGGSNSIVVFLNQTNGAFANAVSYPVNFSGSYYFSPFIFGGFSLGDVNGDGKMDMVVVVTDSYYPSFSTSYLESVTFLGKGDGTFAAPLPEQTATITGAVQMAQNQFQLADMDKDGKLDMVFALGGYDSNGNKATFLSVAKGNGDGTFSGLPTTVPTSGAVISDVSTLNACGFAVADIDGDGNLDVIFNETAAPVYLSLGNGSGQLATPTSVVTDINNPYVVNFADVNGDGNLDVLTYNSGALSVFLNQGKGVFSNTPLSQVVIGTVGGAQGGYQQPVPADFDGDGATDLVAIDTTLNTVGFFLGSNGSYSGGIVLAPPSNTNQLFDVVATGDFNGDGIPDVMGPQQPTNIYQELPSLLVGINDGKGNFSYLTAYDDSTLEDNDVLDVVPIIKDLNGDGFGDIVFTTDYGMAIGFGKGDGTFASLQRFDFTLSFACDLQVTDIGDVNGDGKPDIVVAYEGDAACNGGSAGSAASGIFTMLNLGNNNFSNSFTPIGVQAAEPKLIDLNGDGNLDLVLVDAAPQIPIFFLNVFPGNGDGTFATSKEQNVLYDSEVYSVIPGDFDGDGKQDLTLGVITRIDNSGNPIQDTTGLELLKGNGDFTFGLPTQYAAGLVPIDGRYADFNGDGRPDLALNLSPSSSYTNVQSSGMAYMANVGGGAFGPLVQTFTGPTLTAGYLSVGDFNGDGAIDIVNDGGIGSGLFLNLGAISLTLSANTTTAIQGSPVTFTATLKPYVSTQSPTGTLSIFDNGTLLETVPVSGTTATLTLGSLAVGSHAITASYSGDSNFNAATASAAVSIAVTPLTPNFTLAATPSSLSLVQGATGTVVLALAANNTFSGAVTFACTGAPTEASCTVSPTSTTLTPGATGTVSVVVATTAKNNTSEAANHVPAIFGKAGGITMAGLIFALFPNRRRRRILRSLSMVLLVTIAGIGLLTMSGCGSSDKYPGTPVGSSTLTITATSGSITQTQTIALTITK